MITVNGVDLATLNFRTQGFGLRLSPPRVEWDTYDDPTVPGVHVSTVRRVGRAFSVVGQVGPIATARQNLDQIAWLLQSQQPNIIRFADVVGYSINAYSRSLIARPVRPTLEPANLQLYDVELPFFAGENPFFIEDGTTNVAGIGGGGTAITPVGSADIVDAVLRISGPGGTVEIRVFDYLSNEVAFIQFSDISGAFLVLDLRRATAYVNGTGNPNEGTPVVGPENLTDGAFFILRSAWWQYLTSSFATMTISGGSGTLIYRRTFEGLPI